MYAVHERNMTDGLNRMPSRRGSLSSFFRARNTMELPLHTQHLKTREYGIPGEVKVVIIFGLIVSGLLLLQLYPTTSHEDVWATNRVYVYHPARQRYAAISSNPLYRGQMADLAVAINENLELLTIADGEKSAATLQLSESFDARALAYDPISDTMFVSNTDSNEVSAIYRVDLQRKRDIELLVKEPDIKHRVLGVAYDHVTNTLFWTNGYGKSILHMSLDDPNRNRSVFLHLNNSVTGIAVDVCSRTLFWTTKNGKHGTIERCNLNGSNHQVLITDLHNPTDIAVDPRTQDLFWCDDMEGELFRIETSKLNGSLRHTILSNVLHQPVSIATTETDVYWTNYRSKYLWKVPKNATEEERLEEYALEFNSGTTLGIISRYNSVTKEDCEDFAQAALNSKKSGIEDETSSVTCLNGGTLLDEDKCQCPLGYSGPRCDQEYPNKQGDRICGEGSSSECVKLFCLNGGTLISAGKDSKCKCPNEYGGFRCEKSRCYNYCYNDGDCSINDYGEPQCRCISGYRGSRCQYHVCENFCLNDGRCTVSDGENPSCRCFGGFEGRRCEISPSCNYERTVPLEKKNSSVLCMCTDHDVYNSGNTTYKGKQEAVCENSTNFLLSLVIGLGVFGCFMFLVCIYLMKKVCSLRKRPRIKKRIIVSKNVTPLTSRPPPSDQCEITIENCCNMNICETPCYDLNLRSDTKAVSSKTEEKKNLLGNMEEDSSPCQDSLY